MNAKTIGGCFFGCLAFVFFLVLAFGVALSQTHMGADLPSEVVGLSGVFQYAGGTCCCLSSVMFVVLLALGMKKDQPESYE